MLDVLRSVAGDDEALAVYGTVQTYTIGFAALEFGRARRQNEPAKSHDPVGNRLAGFTTHQQFKRSLLLMLRGVFAQESDEFSPVADVQ